MDLGDFRRLAGLSDPRVLVERFTGKNVHAIEVLEVFDFDDTLFRSPPAPASIPKEAAHPAWWAHAKSLKPPHVQEVPSKDFWVSEVVKAALKAIASPKTYTALISGRAGYEKALKQRVGQILKGKGLTFDEVHLNPSTAPTVSWKAQQVKAMLARLPDVHTLRAWDDRADILGGYASLATDLGIDYEPHLVTAGLTEK